MTNEHTSLEKYTSHTLFKRVAKGLRKGCVWEVSWRRNRDSNMLTPSSSDNSSTSSSFCWAAQPGSWGPKPSVWRWLSLRHLISNNDWSSLPRTELCLPRTPTNWLQLTRTICGTGLYNRFTYTFSWVSQLHRIQPIHGQGYILKSSTGSTRFLIDGRVKGQYVTGCNI